MFVCSGSQNGSHGLEGRRWPRNKGLPKGVWGIENKKGWDQARGEDDGNMCFKSHWNDDRDEGAHRFEHGGEVFHSKRE